MKIFIVIPAYNESKRIAKVITDLEKHNLPIIVVDDGSKDQTFDVIKELPVTAIRDRINLGKGAALKTGCIAAFQKGADAVIIMDGDGQHHPDDIPNFIKALGNNMDMVFGTRNLSYGVPLVRFLGNKFASVLINSLFLIYVSDLLCGYRAFNKRAFEKMNWQSRGYGVETEMVVLTGKYKFKYCEVAVQTIYYDKYKGVTLIDAFGILLNVLKWRLLQ